jgi:protein NirF
LWLSLRDGDQVQVWDPYRLKLLSTLPARAPSGIFFSSRAQKMGY